MVCMDVWPRVVAAAAKNRPCNDFASLRFLVPPGLYLFFSNLPGSMLASCNLLGWILAPKASLVEFLASWNVLGVISGLH